MLDAYLDIAVAVLRTERRPLSPRAILATAYRRGLVPDHLYGQTQHKTLQARLSEDIVVLRDLSAFFRTAPGRFFLREFLTDTTIPEVHRTPIPTRRRVRQLEKGPALALSREALAKIADVNEPIDTKKALRLLDRHCFSLDESRQDNENAVLIRSFVCVQRRSMVLTYRLGAYRENRDTFQHRRSVGFTSKVHPDNHTLFDRDGFGIIESGVRGVQLDLDIHDAAALSDLKSARIHYFIWVSNAAAGSTDLLAVVGFACPDWYEPTKRRLALNDLAWMDFARINDRADYDPWSQSVLAHCPPKIGVRGASL